mmetsp:Transcript_4971/g.21309  ORF Transcript_4971/g.21309 Transcript_4971/m.21309 type:complete len:321 (-) Transcript_4971:149-1111(-)
MFVECPQSRFCSTLGCVRIWEAVGDVFSVEVGPMARRIRQHNGKPHPSLPTECIGRRCQGPQQVLGLISPSTCTQSFHVSLQPGICLGAKAVHRGLGTVDIIRGQNWDRLEVVRVRSLLANIAVRKHGKAKQDRHLRPLFGKFGANVLHDRSELLLHCAEPGPHAPRHVQHKRYIDLHDAACIASNELELADAVHFGGQVRKSLLHRAKDALNGAVAGAGVPHAHPGPQWRGVLQRCRLGGHWSPHGLAREQCPKCRRQGSGHCSAHPVLIHCGGEGSVGADRNAQDLNALLVCIHERLGEALPTRCVAVGEHPQLLGPA